MRARGTEQANPGGEQRLDMFARRRKAASEMDLRTWSLPCDDCGHTGFVNATLRQIKRWVAEEKLVCSACGCIKQAYRSA